MSVQPNLQQWLDQLTQQGYRLTRARLAVMKVLAKTYQPINVGEVYEQIHRSYPQIGRMTVYRTMEQLEVLGVIRRLHTGCHSYTTCPEGEWVLMICEDCGQAQYLATQNLISKLAEEQAFVVRSHSLQVFGRCSVCQPSTKP